MEGTEVVQEVKKQVGMAWAGPILRTFLQAALPVLIAAGTDFVDVELWKVAALSGGASVLAYIQQWARD